MIEKLVESGADVNKMDSEGRTALMAASFMDHSKIVEILLNSEAEPNVILCFCICFCFCLRNDRFSSAFFLLRTSMDGLHQNVWLVVEVLRFDEFFIFTDTALCLSVSCPV